MNKCSHIKMNGNIASPGYQKAVITYGNKANMVQPDYSTLNWWKFMGDEGLQLIKVGQKAEQHAGSKMFFTDKASDKYSPLADTGPFEKLEKEMCHLVNFDLFFIGLLN